MEYRVQLEVFSGPLDLLLYLVRRQELEIVDLPIAAITGQFLEFLEVLELLDLELAIDFVVMASSLVEIKSRMVLPQPAEQPVEMVEVESDPRADLVRQLLEYKRFKDASKLLEEHASDWQQRYPRLSDDHPQSSSNPAHDHIKEVELWDLVSALSRILRTNTASAPRSIVYDDTPISTYIERIREKVLAEGSVKFSDFFEGANVRSKITGIFLAILELLRHYKFRAHQPDPYHEIWVEKPLETASDVAPEPAPESPELLDTGDGSSPLELSPTETPQPEPVAAI